MKTCMVVDDAPFDRALLKRSAEKIGFTVTEAACGDEALALCRDQLPDCILLDWKMGATSGISVLQEIRSMRGGGNVCVLICTSNQHPSFIGHALVNGASGYIIKPITIELLKAKLDELQGFPRQSSDAL